MCPPEVGTFDQTSFLSKAAGPVSSSRVSTSLRGDYLRRDFFFAFFFEAFFLALAISMVSVSG
jgi:hypothetical protein